MAKKEKVRCATFFHIAPWRVRRRDSRGDAVVARRVIVATRSRIPVDRAEGGSILARDASTGWRRRDACRRSTTAVLVGDDFYTLFPRRGWLERQRRCRGFPCVLGRRCRCPIARLEGCDALWAAFSPSRANVRPGWWTRARKCDRGGGLMRGGGEGTEKRRASDANED